VSEPGDYKGMERGRWLNRYSVGSFCLQHGFSTWQCRSGCLLLLREPGH
jgi:hypothetical protein